MRWREGTTTPKIRISPSSVLTNATCGVQAPNAFTLSRTWAGELLDRVLLLCRQFCVSTTAYQERLPLGPT